MPELNPTVDLDPRFSSDEAGPRPWSEVLTVLDEAEVFWLSTVRRDGRPHVTPLPAVWLDQALHFCTGPTEQKAKNIESNPQCILTTGNNRFESGLDVIVEGRAERVTDEALLNRLAEKWASKLDWEFEVFDGAFHDPAVETDDKDESTTAMAYVFVVAPVKVLAFGKGEPYSQTRYRF